jgi:hypothetical protein
MNPTPGQNDAGDASNHHGNLSTTARFHLEVQLAGDNCQLAPHVNSGNEISVLEVNEAPVFEVSISAPWKTKIHHLRIVLLSGK